MSSRDEVVQGGRELNAILSTLAPKIHKNILRSALIAGAQVYKKEVLANVPRVSGDLARSVRTTSRIDNRRGRVTASVKAGGPKAPHGISVEFGTRPHTIDAGTGHSLSVGSAQYRSVSHPGAERKPFMRPAADRGFVPAVAAVRKKIRERLNKRDLSTPAAVE